MPNNDKNNFLDFQRSLSQIGGVVNDVTQTMSDRLSSVQGSTQALVNTMTSGFEGAETGALQLQGAVSMVAGQLDDLAASPSVQQTIDQFQDLSEEGEKSFRKLDGSSRSFHGNFTETLTKMVTTGKVKFSELINSLVHDLAKLLIYNAITKPLTQFVSGLFSFGGESGGAALNLPGRAEGGPVSGGSAYMVGEIGPEVFVPNTSGTIVPNRDLKMGTSGQAPVSVNHQWTIVANDTRGFDELLAARKRTIENWSVQSIQRAFNKRGRFGPLDSGRT